MIYAYTILYVPDVPQTIEFYEQAFGFTRKFITEEQDYGELISGGTTLAFASEALGQSNLRGGFLSSALTKPPFGIELAFTTENIASDLARAIEAGAIEEEPLAQKPWGQQVAYLRDLNGFLIEVCTPMST